MRNLLLAITSFFATVLILSQVALAEDDESGDPKHNVSAQGDEPNTPNDADKATTESSVANAGHKCKDGTCFKRTVGGRLHDPTAAKPSGSSTTKGGTSNNEGEK